MSKPKAAESAPLDPIPAEEVDPTAMTPDPSPSAEPPPAPGAERITWLTAVASEAFGPAGHFHDLTAKEAAAAPDGVLVEPTPDQLALRAR